MLNVLWLSQSTPPPPDEVNQPPADEVCYENIGPRERALRARLGYLTLAAAVVLTAVLLVMDAAWWWRLLVFFPFAGGVASWLQARERT